LAKLDELLLRNLTVVECPLEVVAIWPLCLGVETQVAPV
jgi:hypothetical protein